jgi:hypothetical protein
MFEYVDSLGQIYTEDDINKMAAEQKTSADAIIKGKKLKQKSTKTPVSAKPKEKKYPWSDNQTKKEPGFLDEFKKTNKEKKANIKKNTEKVSNFVGQQTAFNPLVQEDPLQKILNPASDFEEVISKVAATPIKKDWEVLSEKENEVVNYIKNKPIDYGLIDQLYQDEINDSQTIDYIREGAKNLFNDVVLGPVSMVGQALGADIDLTISPFKPLERQKKEAINILSKTKNKDKKITNAEIDNLAKELFYKEQVLLQEGKAAEEYWDNQPLYLPEVAAQKEKLKIKAAQDVLKSSDLARQQTILAKTYGAELTSFEKYAQDFKAKYESKDVTDEEIAEYELKRTNAVRAKENLNGIYNNFPNYIDKIKTAEEKLEYFKYNYDDVTSNIQAFIGTSLNIIGGAGKMLGTTIEFIEDPFLSDSPGIGSLLSEASGETIKLGNEFKKDIKSVSFDEVNSFADFGKYSSRLLAEQVPVYAALYFGGSYGAATTSLGAGGQRIQEMEEEAGSNYSLGTKLLAGYGFAFAEFIPEKLGTLRMFDNMKRVMSSVDSQPRKMFKDSFIKSSLYTTGLVGIESQIEGGTEVLTEGLGMLIDEHLFGKSVPSFERSKRFKEAYAAGAFMGGGLQLGGGVSTLVAKELKNYATEQEMAASKKIMDRITFLQNELQTNTKLSGKESEEIRTEINKLASESIRVIENSKDRVYDMSTEDMTSVLEINKKQQETKDAYIELSQSNFSPEIKREKAIELKEQFKKLESDREFLLTGQYAMANKIISDRAVINNSVENIKKISSALEEVEIANNLGNQGAIAVFENVEDLKKSYREWLIIENNNTKKAIQSGELPANTEIKSEEQINADVENAAQSDGFNLPNGQSVINLSVASRKGAINVAQHEFLHTVLSKALSNTQERKKVVNDFLSVLTAKERAIVQKRIDDNYRYGTDEKGNRVENNFDDYNEEYLTAFIDAIAYGEIGDKNQIKDVLRRAARPILKVLQKMGFSNARFSEGRDFYDFLKDYQSNASKGRISNRAKSLLAGEPISRTIRYSKSIEERMDELDDQLNNNEIDYDTYEVRMIALEKEEAELARKEYEEKKAEAKQPTEKKVETKPTEKKPTKEKEAPELSEIAAKAKTKLDAIGNDPKGFNPNNPAIYSELDKMVKAKSRNWRTAKGTIINFTNKDKGGLDGFDMDEMTSYVRTSMIPYINKFDPSKNNSLYGYINAQYANRMKAALKSGEVADVVFTEDVTEMTKLSSADVEFTRPSLPERKRFQNILESGVFSPDVIDNIQAKILPVVRTLKSKINEKTSLNKTVVPIISEIRDEMGKQADIDIKKAMGGKENQELQNWLITNKKTILENMTTTWLMGKDNGKVVLGGMPFAIQKKVAERWLSYPDWIGKKVDRESVETDLAGRTAGHEMVRRLPEVNKNVSTIEFLSSIIDLETGNPIRGRKESLAKAMAEEISFDIISDDIANDGIIAEALNRNQELKGAIIEKIMVEEFNRLTERGNIKFSLTGKNIDVNAAIKYLVSAKGDIDIINLSLKEPSKDYNTNQFKKLHKYLISNRVTEDDINTVISKYTEILNKAGYGYHEKFIESIINSTSNKGIVAKNYGGNNNVLPDIVMGKKSRVDNIAAIRKNRNSIAFIEVKLSPFARITSSTLSSLIDKYSNEEWFDGVNDIYDKFKKSTLYATLSEHFEKDTAGNVAITKARAIKIKPEGITKVKELLAGNISIGEKNIPLSSVKTINSNKPYPNDLLVLGTYVTDYFGPDFLSTYNINLGQDNNMNPDIINARIELKMDTGGFIRARIYFTISKPIANLIYKINKESNNLNTIKRKAEVIIDNKINTKYSKSLENNLNSFNKDNKSITLVSDYIKENELKRIDAETAFDVLNDLNKSIEEWWGVVENNTIDRMMDSVDYAFDVIEDRENEGGPLMAAVNGALNIETIKFAEKQLNEWINNDTRWKGTPKFSKSLDYEFNDMLERNTGVESYEKISDIVAKRKGAKANRLSFFIPPSAEDFRGLTTYMFAGKGKQGELDQQFFDENLVIPYVKGINALDSVRQSIKREYKALLADFPDIKSKLEKLTPDKQFTYDQAIRVYLWNKNDIEVPGLSRRDKNKLVYLVKNDPNLVSFAESLSIAGRQDGGWMEPSATWDAETIISELHNITEGEGRKKWLSEFIENANAIFSPENLNKVQSIYGTNVRVALEDSLYRMKNGKNRPEGTDALTNKWMNWINGATAAIMFFNVRSALLQNISSINYLNWNDNNPLMAAKAFANQKQYWSDFATIINSDKMKERRAGLKADVTQAEIANAANSATNKAKGILSYLQKIGFTPTQAADSFSIAIGGAAFYRNRVNTYLEQADEDGNKINTQEEAEAKAWIDFSEITDQSMQSADPLYVSKQQTTSLGRLVLAFANTPMQYNRLIKKASLDLVNKRGDWKTNMSKILYYGALQNFIFSALQSALFMPFVDDDDEKLTANMSEEQKAEFEKLKKKQDDKTINILNGMVDTVLRGSGITGALIATIKNAAMEYNKQEQKEMFADHAYTFLAAAGISPPISSKARKLYGIHRVRKFEKDVIEERGWEVTRDGRLNLSPNYSIVGNAVVATTNIPLDRVIEKVDNLSEALDARNTALQRAALALGWKEWELNVKNEENEIIKAAAKIKRKEEGIEKAIKTREEKSIAKKQALRNMTPEERLKYRKREALEKREKALKKRKRKMGGD